MSQMPISEPENQHWVEKALHWLNRQNLSYSQVEDLLKENGLSPKEVNQIIQQAKEFRQKKATGNRKTSLIMGIALVVVGLFSPIITLAIGIPQETSVAIAGGMGAMGIVTLIMRGKK